MLWPVKQVCAKGENRKAFKCVGKLKFNEMKKTIYFFIAASILFYFGFNKQFQEETIKEAAKIESVKDNRVLKSGDTDMGEDNLSEIILNVDEGEDSILFQSFERDILRFRNDSLNSPENRTPSETKLLLEAFLNLKFDNLNAFDSSKFDTTYFDVDFFDETLLDGNDIITQYENLSSFFSDEELEIKFIDIIGEVAEGESYTYKIVTNKGWLRQLGWKTELGSFNKGYYGYGNGSIISGNLGAAIHNKMNSLYQFARFNTNAYYNFNMLPINYGGLISDPNPITLSGCMAKSGHLWCNDKNIWLDKNTSNTFLNKGWELAQNRISKFLNDFPNDKVHHLIFHPANDPIGNGTSTYMCGNAWFQYGNYFHSFETWRVKFTNYIPSIL